MRMVFTETTSVVLLHLHLLHLLTMVIIGKVLLVLAIGFSGRVRAIMHFLLL